VVFSTQETLLSYENTILPNLEILVTGMEPYFQNKYLTTFSQNLLGDCWDVRQCFVRQLFGFCSTIEE
jgi:hypothetical protein